MGLAASCRAELDSGLPESRRAGLDSGLPGHPDSLRAEIVFILEPMTLNYYKGL